MLNKPLVITALMLAASGSVMADIVFANTNALDNTLNYRMVGKVVCYDTKISTDGQAMLDTSLQARVQEIRGEDVQVDVKAIKVSASDVAAPQVLVMDGVSFSRGETVWTKNKGWYVCP